MFEEIMNFNKEFVKNRKYLSYTTDKFPAKNIAILTCMDTRLIELLPASMNLKNGDAKIIKNAGAMLTHPYGSVMRSLIVAIFELEVKEIIIIGHYGCGMHNLNSKNILKKMDEQKIDYTKVAAEVDLEGWLQGFANEDEQIKNTIQMIKDHPLVPKDMKIYGCLMDPATGELVEIN